MKINWKIRFKQKQFIVSMGAALFIAVQAIGKLFGYHLSDSLGSEVSYALNTVLSVLVVMGVVTDHTTEGLNDSEEALKRSEPKYK